MEGALPKQGKGTNRTGGSTILKLIWGGHLPELLFLGVLIFLDLFYPRKFLGVLSDFSCFPLFFWGFSGGSEGAKKNPKHQGKEDQGCFIFQGLGISNRTKPGNSAFALRACPGLSGPLNRLNAILSLLQSLDRYRTLSAVGSAIGRPYLALFRIPAHR